MPTCPHCGDRCAQAWCGFCERALEIPSCAFRKCDDPNCYWCVVLPQRFAVVPCPTLVEDQACRFVKGHPPPCQPKSKRKRRRDPETRLEWAPEEDS